MPAALVSCYEIDNHGWIDERMVRRYVRRFRAVIDEVVDVLEATALAGGTVPAGSVAVPAQFTTYSYKQGADIGATLRDYDGTERDPDSPKVWIIQCNYSSEISPQRMRDHPGTRAGGVPATSARGDSAEVDPSQLPVADVRFGTVKFTKTFWLDKKGSPAINTAYEMYDPPLEHPTAFQTMTISRWELAHDPSSAADFIESINSDAVTLTHPAYASTTYAAGQLACDDIQAESGFFNDLLMARVTYHFLIGRSQTVANVIRWDGAAWALTASATVYPHSLLVLNAGYNQLVSGASVPIQKSGIPVAKPWPLSLAGAAIAEASILGSRTYQEFYPRAEKAFASLGNPPLFT